ncbi:hypothetical protein [Tolypothrix sp. VBCCA 56010]|uniref:hypothetical protein n=1 Tax=Tolypothrix sp. VBCCA 56010 TaxID=3137731 RepID=UPI003D7E4AF1
MSEQNKEIGGEAAKQTHDEWRREQGDQWMARQREAVAERERADVHGGLVRIRELEVELTTLRARLAELEKIEAEAKAAGMIGPDGKLMPFRYRGDFGGPLVSVRAVYEDGTEVSFPQVVRALKAAEAARAAKEGGGES